MLVRTLIRRPKPPFAVFDVTNERVEMVLRDPATGEVTLRDWPPSAVVEMRANRYEQGLWVNVTGHVKETCLADLPRATIEQIEAALRLALNGGSTATSVDDRPLIHP